MASLRKVGTFFSDLFSKGKKSKSKIPIAQRIRRPPKPGSIEYAEGFSQFQKYSFSRMAANPEQKRKGLGPQDIALLQRLVEELPEGIKSGTDIPDVYHSDPKLQQILEKTNTAKLKTLILAINAELSEMHQFQIDYAAKVSDSAAHLAPHDWFTSEFSVHMGNLLGCINAELHKKFHEPPQ